jgi:hypothetical protein
MKKNIRESQVGNSNDWTIVQVAAFIKRPYQTTRNMMLSGEFGLTRYDEKSRRLTVRSSAVRAWKAPEREK